MRHIFRIVRKFKEENKWSQKWKYDADLKSMRKKLSKHTFAMTEAKLIVWQNEKLRFCALIELLKTFRSCFFIAVVNVFCFQQQHHYRSIPLDPLLCACVGINERKLYANTEINVKRNSKRRVMFLLWKRYFFEQPKRTIIETIWWRARRYDKNQVGK